MAKTQKNPHHYITILCGGTGPRLWPLSRASHPKQFLKLFGKTSLLRQTIKRSQKIVPSKNIFITTNKKYLSLIKKELPKNIPAKNILAEPQKKNTLMAMLFSSFKIKQLDPNAVITFFPSDHFIDKIDKFVKNIKECAQIAIDSNSIVIIGIKPTRPDPSYGYVITKKFFSGKVKPVNSFIEKPDPIKAQKLIKKKNTYWNSGIYTFTPKTLFEEIEKYQPQYSFNLIKVDVDKAYKQCPKLSIDVGISQLSKKLKLIPADFAWSDIGEWETIFNQSAKDKENNAKLDKDTTFVTIDSQGCLLKSDKNKLIGLVGIKDIAVIDTKDALLICDLKKALNVRDLVGKIVSTKKTINYFLDKK
ncbi:hypothetical protein KKA02_03780 [Patescibacteria group bacterium]|nr:hypothetical protein [Patescibacteria group bacterium]